MIDTGLAALSDSLFWWALAAYGVAMVASFAFLAFKKDRLGSLAVGVTWLGAAVHLGSVTARGLAAGRVPWGNMYEYSSLLGLLLVLVYLLWIDRRLGLREFAGFALGAAVLSLAFARMVYVPARELVPALNSIWLKFHVIAAIIGSTLFGISFLFTVLTVTKRRWERRTIGSTVGAAHVSTFEPETEIDPALPPEPRRSGLMARLPSSLALDRMSARTVAFAFPIWTFAVLAGAVWAHEAWGRYWGWDPKETWAFVTWVIYAAELHARSTAGWKGTRVAVINTVGFAAVMFTYFAVNLWIAGLHSYAK
ncbi:MAG: c-type cytochrome biogenesis protein CcsB [Actinomycetota bacterium]